MECVLLTAYTAVARQYSVQGEFLNLILEFLVMMTVVIKSIDIKNHLYILFAHFDVLGYSVETAAALAVRYKMVLSELKKDDDGIWRMDLADMEQKFRKASFGFDDYLESMGQMKQMGGLSSVLSMLPGVGGSQMKMLEDSVDEGAVARTEAIILSMTPEERKNPDILNPSRKARIARGAGVDISEVNKLVKQFEQARKMMKQFGPMMKGKGKMGRFKLPF